MTAGPSAYDLRARRSWITAERVSSDDSAVSVFKAHPHRGLSLGSQPAPPTQPFIGEEGRLGFRRREKTQKTGFCTGNLHPRLGYDSGNFSGPAVGENNRSSMRATIGS